MRRALRGASECGALCDDIEAAHDAATVVWRVVPTAGVEPATGKWASLALEWIKTSPEREHEIKDLGARLAEIVSPCLDCGDSGLYKCDRCDSTRTWRHTCNVCLEEHTVDCDCDGAGMVPCVCQIVPVRVDGESFDARRLKRASDGLAMTGAVRLGVIRSADGAAILRVVNADRGVVQMHCRNQPDDLPSLTEVRA